METISAYEQQAIDFLKSTNTKFNAEFLKHDKHFQDDKETRDIYKITFKRGSRKWSFSFGQSIKNSGFYAIYGKTTYNIPREKLSLTNTEIERWIKYNIQWDFGTVKKDTIHYPVEPTAYDVLSCITKYNVDTFEDFCNEFCYDNDSRSAKKIYKAVRKEWLGVQTMWSDTEIEQLQEIQ